MSSSRATRLSSINATLELPAGSAYLYAGNDSYVMPVFFGYRDMKVNLWRVHPQTCPHADIPRFKHDIPANEHLSMQLASQLFGIATAVNAVIRFADGELAYITRRFDRRNQVKIGQEDFCQLSNRTEETADRNYKYNGSYTE
jgi:hypothetical protein